jgi:TonB family protein
MDVILLEINRNIRGDRATRASALLLLLLGTSALADDAPVRPPELDRASPAAYPASLVGSGVEGEVRLRLTISASGEVTQVELVSSPDVALAAAASDAARGLHFLPARQGEAAVAVVLEYTYRFLVGGADGGVRLGGPSEPLAELTGTVRTQGTREPVVAAQVRVDDGHTAETDATGRFVVPVTPGARSVSVTAAAHHPAVFQETLQVSQRLEVVYRVLRVAQRPYETVVRAQADRAEVSRVQLTGAELREVAGTGGEPLRVVMMLPGVTSLASGLSYPVVRGSVPAATGFYLDGVRVPQLYHLALGPSVVHPEFIDSIDFFPANAPSSFGNLTAGVVAASVRAPRERVHVEGSVDLINAGVYAEVPLPSTGTSVTLAGRVSYTGWLLALATGARSGQAKPVADFYDYQARVEQRVGKASLRVLAFGSSDLVGARPVEPEATATFLTSRFHRVDLRARVPLGAGKLEAGATAGWEELGILQETSGDRSGAFLLGRFLLSARAQWRVELPANLALRFAGDVERQVARTERTSDASDASGGESGAALASPPGVLGVLAGLSAEASWNPERLAVVAGLRLASFHAQGGVQRWGLEPRLSARFAVTDALTVKAGAGLFHQPPTLLLNLPISDLAALGDGLQETVHLALGVEAKLWGGVELGLEGFFNPMTQVREKSLPEFLSGSTSYLDKNSARYGRSYGLEVLLRAPARGRWFGWVSYSLMRSERLRAYPVFGPQGELVRVDEAFLPFAFDQTHTVNVVVGSQLPLGFRVSGTLHFNTGRPESGEVSSRTMEPSTDGEGASTWRAVPLDQVQRLPPFFRLDARVSKEWTLKDVMLELFLDFFNLTLSQEVYGYTYGVSSGDLTKKAFTVPVFVPALGLKGTY